MEYWEEKYDNLLRKYERLQRDYEKLQNDYNKKDNELYSANFKIETELEPRIQSERRSYDAWVTDPMRGHYEDDE
jgi:predicted nuclease with TOPRIM domain